MARRFFVGESSADSIIKIAANVDRQFLEISQPHHTKDSYEPWMAIPSELLIFEKTPNWQKGSLFFSSHELNEFKSLVGKLNPNQPNIYSLESYPIKISNLNIIENDHFQSKILEAKCALVDKLKWIEPIYHALVHKIVPVEGLNEDDDSDYGMSTVWLKGVIFYDKRQHKSFEFRVENIAHELAHQVIINYQLSDRLIEDDLNAPVYSGIRKTNRPAIMAFHGAAALSYMFLAANAFGAVERSYIIKADLTETLKSLSEIRLTPVGKIIIREIHELIE